MLTREGPLHPDRKPNSANWRLPHPLQGGEQRHYPPSPTYTSYPSKLPNQYISASISIFCPPSGFELFPKLCRSSAADPVRGGRLQTAPKDHPVKGGEHNALFQAYLFAPKTINMFVKISRKVPKYTNHLVQIALFEVYFVCTKKYQKELKRSKNTNNFG